MASTWRRKGTTINDLGGGGGNFRNKFIFSREPLPYKIYAVLCGEGPPKFFFSISSGPTPRSLMIVPLVFTDAFLWHTTKMFPWQLVFLHVKHWVHLSVKMYVTNPTQVTLWADYSQLYRPDRHCGPGIWLNKTMDCYFCINQLFSYFKVLIGSWNRLF